LLVFELSYDNSTTIDENSMKEIKKAIFSNGIHTKKYGIFFLQLSYSSEE